MESLEFQGAVKETMVSGGYTYVLVEADGNSIWLAAADGDFEVGQTVAWNGGIAMPNFHSNTLDRTFEMIYFVDAVTPVPHPGG